MQWQAPHGRTRIDCTVRAYDTLSELKRRELSLYWRPILCHQAQNTPKAPHISLEHVGHTDAKIC